MFIALYHWKIKHGSEEKFQEGWHRRTLEIRANCGGSGSRLHRAEDGSFIAYAQWKNKEMWENLPNFPIIDKEASAMVRDSIEESLPTTFMEVLDDLLISKEELKKYE
ncbi:hypothetical protein BH10ACI1_BH10ACI1_10320 [soil metagenome]